MSRAEAVLRVGLAPVWRLRNKGKNRADLWIELKQAVRPARHRGIPQRPRKQPWRRRR